MPFNFSNTFWLHVPLCLICSTTLQDRSFFIESKASPNFLCKWSPWMLFWLAKSLWQSVHFKLEQPKYHGRVHMTVKDCRFVKLTIIAWMDWLSIPKFFAKLVKQSLLRCNGPSFTCWHFTLGTQSQEEDVSAYGTVSTIVRYLRFVQHFYEGKRWPGLIVCVTGQQILVALSISFVYGN